MENINKIAQIGDLFERRDGEKVIYMGKDDSKHLYKYRFRLLSEHKIWVKHCKFYNEGISEKLFINCNDYLHSYKDIWYNKFNIEYGDYYVRFNGCSTNSVTLENDWDVIKKLEE